ncbi:OmpA family protein, partial [uncultured Parabacteroides sp.]|uniref:OmpA family protein n=1 Tax=uncultured Parabacteroides sp. TaxID=512312 RepID=UPI0025CD564D
MDNNVITIWVAALAVLTGGCSAVHTASGENRDTIADKQVSLVREQIVAQVQVDAETVYRQMIEFFQVPEKSDTASVPEEIIRSEVRRLDASLSFKPGSVELTASYGQNSKELAGLCNDLNALLADRNVTLQSVEVTGYSSPDGNTSKNEELATGRALRLCRYLGKEMRLPENIFVVRQSQEDWDGLKRAVSEARKPYAMRVMALLDSLSQPDVRRKALGSLDKGKVWKDMENTLFAGLRRIQVNVVYQLTETGLVDSEENATCIDFAHLLTAFQKEPERLTLDELLRVALAFRPGTEQYREVYELAAYRFPDCEIAQLNAGAAALSMADTVACPPLLGPGE